MGKLMLEVQKCNAQICELGREQLGSKGEIEKLKDELREKEVKRKSLVEEMEAELEAEES